MEKVKKYSILAITLFCLIKPPIDMNFKMTFTPHTWLFIVLAACMLTFLLCLSKINVWVRLLTAWILVNTLIGQYPLQSIWYFLFVMAAAMFYLLCFHSAITVKDIVPIFPTVMLLQLLFLALQTWGVDPIFKSLTTQVVLFGAVGEPMRLCSFAVCSSGFLVLYKKWLILPVIGLTILLNSSGAFNAVMLGVILYGVMNILKYYKGRRKVAWVTITALLCSISILSSMFLYLDGKFEFFNAPNERWAAWKKTVYIANHKPIQGWGLDTYKILFPINSEKLFKPLKAKNPEWWIGDKKGDWLIWREAHNDWLQMYFELGLIGIFIIGGYVISCIYRFIKSEKSQTIIIIMSGMIVCGADMIGHFPMRMIRVIPVIILLLILFEKNLRLKEKVK